MTPDNTFTIHIGGEATKRHTIPVDMLSDIGKSLQDFLQKIALYDLPSNDAIDPSNFKIELAEFEVGGSVTPTFTFTENINLPPVGTIQQQREGVVKKFNGIMEIAGGGDYLKLRDMYREPIRRNEIVGSLYGFVSSFKNAPVDIIYKSKNSTTSIPIRKFKQSIRDAMITEVKSEVKGDQEKSTQIARVSVVREKGKSKVLRTKVVELFDKKIGADYSTDTIVYNETVYELSYRLHCTVDQSEDFIKIESDMLGIFGHGKTIDEAEKSFAEEFDYIHHRYNELPNKKLSKDVLAIKSRLSLLVKNVSR